MSGPLSPPGNLQVHELGPLGALLGSGNQAKIFDLPALHLPDSARPLVYKRYKPGKAPKHGMNRIVALRTGLLADPAKLDRLEATTAWPVRQVVDAGGELLGLVLARIPDTFFHDIRLPSGGVKSKPREVQFLFIPPDYALRGGTPTPTPAERLTICRDFAATLSFLHGELGVVFGDINARNAVFRIGTDPTVMFVDCDAVRRVGDMAGVPQLNAPDWEPPQSNNVLSQATDLYKLGLFVLRCLTPGHFCSSNRDPNEARGVLDAQGLALLNAAIRGPADQRPSAETWHRYLRRTLGEALNPPHIERLDPDRTIVAAGEPLTLSWSAEEADTLEVSGVGVPTMSVSGTVGWGAIVVHPTRTGTITVVARNQLGEHSVRTPPVAVFDVPSFQDLPVPMPTLSLLPRTLLDLPQVGAVLPPFPAGKPVPVPPMANVLTAWLETEDRMPPDPVDVAGPAPSGGLLRPTIPIDVTAIMSGIPDDDASQKARP